MALVIGGKWKDTRLKNIEVYTTYGAREMTRTVPEMGRADTTSTFRNFFWEAQLLQDHC